LVLLISLCDSRKDGRVAGHVGDLAEVFEDAFDCELLFPSRTPDHLLRFGDPDQSERPFQDLVDFHGGEWGLQKSIYFRSIDGADQHLRGTLSQEQDADRFWRVRANLGEKLDGCPSLSITRHVLAAD